MTGYFQREGERLEDQADAVARERASRQEAQRQLEDCKGRLARARLDLQRELLEQGWTRPPEPEAQQAEPSDARVEAYTSERHFALREAHCIKAGDDYYAARPHLNGKGPRRETFDAGFERGFDKATELADARAVLQAADAVSAGVAVPDGYALVPEKATPLIREALRIGMRREVPNDELCDIRWRAAIAAAAPGSEQKEGANG